MRSALPHCVPHAMTAPCQVLDRFRWFEMLGRLEKTVLDFSESCQESQELLETTR